MKTISKRFFSGICILVIALLGYEVASHEASIYFKPTHPQPRVEKISLIDSASAQSLDRGFADLVKRVIPGVVNISTYAHPRMQPGNVYGYGSDAQNELFRRFFEEFFGGRVPPPRGQAPQGRDDDDDGSQDSPNAPPSAAHGKAVPVALGTGFIIDANEGLILTNNHVVEGAEEVKIQFKEEETDLVPAEIIGRDAEIDVALLKVKSKTKLTAIPLGDSDAIDVGEYVLAIGNPLGYGHTVSHGILSAKGRRNPEFRMGRYLQTDASINPGNSGGPLINARGEVIGINNAIDARAQGIGFAIPINLVKAILPQLKSKGSVSRAFLGVSAVDLTPDLAAQLNLDEKVKGVIVSDVQPAGPADRAGIKPYDIITSVNGSAIESASDLTLKIAGNPVGSSVKVNILRSGKPKILSVKLSERPNEFARSNKGKNSVEKGAGFDAFGFRAANVIQGGNKTVVITDIAEGSPAADAGLERGDFILDVAGKEVHTTADLERSFKNTKAQSILVRVKRTDQNGNDFVSVIVLQK
jgi:serine protease Do